MKKNTCNDTPYTGIRIIACVACFLVVLAIVAGYLSRSKPLDESVFGNDNPAARKVAVETCNTVTGTMDAMSLFEGSDYVMLEMTTESGIPVHVWTTAKKAAKVHYRDAVTVKGPVKYSCKDGEELITVGYDMTGMNLFGLPSGLADVVKINERT